MPPAPVYGSTRADTMPASTKDVAAARSDPHNPALNEFLRALDVQHVFLKTTPAEPGGAEAVTAVYFDVKKAPYSGPLVLFSVRPGGGELRGRVTNLTLVTVLIRNANVVGLELNDPAAFTPDDPAAVPSSVPTTD